jgi:hypothetical protein
MSSDFILACATCKPDAGSIMAHAQDSAVLVMLGFLVIGFAFVGLIVFNFVRRQRALGSTNA